MRIATIWLALIAASWGNAAAQNQNPDQAPQSLKARKPAVRITISAPNTSVRVGSDVLLEVTTTNLSRHTLSVYSRRFLAMSIRVRDSEGKEPLTKKGKCILARPDCELLCENCSIANLPLYSGQTVDIGPSKSLSETVPVPQAIYDLSRPGKYTVQWQEGYPDAVLKSNTVTVTIIP